MIIWKRFSYSLLCVYLVYSVSIDLHLLILNQFLNHAPLLFAHSAELLIDVGGADFEVVKSIMLRDVLSSEDP